MLHSKKSKSKLILEKLIQAIGLDFHVVLTLLFRFWSVIAGAGMLVLLPFTLTPTQMGFHYTFSSLMALQIFFELGMNQVVTQITSHELAHLKISNSDVLIGESSRLDRLTQLTNLLNRWYGASSLIFFVTVSVAGIIFFSKNVASNNVSWTGPWILLCFCTSGNLYLSPTLAILEGAGRIGEVARVRLIQSVLGYCLMALALLFGKGLWASSMIALSACVVTAIWITRSARLVRWLRVRKLITNTRLDWRREVFPFQWRIALSWISGYFIFQLFTPMIFQNQGATQAGKFGMVLAIFNAIQSVGMSWVYSRGPLLAQCISRSNGIELRRSFIQAVKASIGFTTLASVTMVLIIWIMQMVKIPLVERLSTLSVIVFIAATTVINSIIFAFAVFMRAHKEEPLMLASVVLALLTLGIVYWSSKFSVELTAGLYMMVTLIVGFPWTYIIFQRYWSRYKYEDNTGNYTGL